MNVHMNEQITVFTNVHRNVHMNVLIIGHMNVYKNVHKNILLNVSIHVHHIKRERYPIKIL